jgi:hypothetical protein
VWTPVNTIIKFWFSQKAGNERLLDSEEDFHFRVRVAGVRTWLYKGEDV